MNMNGSKFVSKSAAIVAAFIAFVCTASAATVARIGDAPYETLAAAVAAIGEMSPKTGTITMLANETMAGNVGVTIPGGYDVTIDLNGFRICNDATENTHSATVQIAANGKLTVQDTSAGANGAIINAVAEGTNGDWSTTPKKNWSSDTVVNHGTFVLNGGNVINTTGGISYCIDNESNVSACSFVMNGGKLYNNYGDQAVRVYANSGASINQQLDNRFEMHGGEIVTGGFWVQMAGAIGGDYDAAKNQATVIIDGGTVNGFIDVGNTGVCDVQIGGNAVINASKMRFRSLGGPDKFMKITGGTVNVAAFDDQTASGYNPVVVSGGTFDAAAKAGLEDYAAEGYEFVSSGDRWVVQATAVPVCQIVETGLMYGSFADAVQDVAEGQTVKLLGDLTIPSSDGGDPGRVKPSVSYTLDGDGHAITCENASEWDWDGDGKVVTFDNVTVVGGRTAAGGTFYFMNSRFTNHTTIDCYQLYTYRNTCFVDATSRLIGRTEEFHLRKGFVVVGAADFDPASVAITETNATAQLYTKRLGMRESGVLALTNANVTAEQDIRSNSVKTKYSDIIATNSLIEIGRSVEYISEGYPLGSWCPNAVPNGRGSLTLAASQRVDIVSCVLRGANSFSNAGLFVAKDSSIEFGNDFTNTGDLTLDGSDMVLGTDFTGPSSSGYHGNFVNDGTIFLRNGATLSYRNKAASAGTVVVSGSTLELANADIKADETMTFDAASKITFTGTWNNAGDVSFDLTGATEDQYVLVENNGSATVDVAGYAVTLANGEGYELQVIDGDLCAVKTAQPVAMIGETPYMKLADAIAAAAGMDPTVEKVIELQSCEITEAIKLPATLKNVTFRGQSGGSSVLKDMTINGYDGNAYDYENLWFDGIVFDNSRIIVTGGRAGAEINKNWKFTGNTFENLTQQNYSYLHFASLSAGEPAENFTFNGNVVDGSTYASAAALNISSVSGTVEFKNNCISNLLYRPANIQIANNDGLADEVTVTGNKFVSNASDIQVLTKVAAGTDAVTIVINENVFDGDGEEGFKLTDDTGAATVDVTHNYYAGTTPTVKVNGTSVEVKGDAAADLPHANNASFSHYAGLTAAGAIDPATLVEVVNNVAQAISADGTVTNGYETLKAAFDNVENGGTVRMIADTRFTFDTQENSMGYIVVSGKSVTLDLNGKVIESGYVGTATSTYLFRSSGTLTIRDSAGKDANGMFKGKIIHSANPTWVISEGDRTGYASGIIRNCATVVIKGGRLEHQSTGTATCVIDNTTGNGWTAAAGTFLTIEDGELVTPAYWSVRLFASDTGALPTNSVAISGGYIQARYYSVFMHYGNGDNPPMLLDISGGEFRATDGSFDCNIEAWQDGEAHSNRKVTISGGRFHDCLDINVPVAITGGLFAKNGEEEDGNYFYGYTLAEACAPGHAVVANDDPDTVDDFPWTIGEANYVAHVGGGLTYTRISQAISAASGDVYLDMNFWGMVGCEDADGNPCPKYLPTTDETLYRDIAVGGDDPEAWVSAKYIFDTYLAAGKKYAGYQTSYLYTASQVDASFTTIADAVASATKGSVITLLAAVQDDIALPYMVTLDKNGFECGAVTAATGYAVVTFGNGLKRTYMDSWERPDLQDLSWYDAGYGDMHIATPAQFAGFAAVVNGKAVDMATGAEFDTSEVTSDSAVFRGFEVVLDADIDLRAHSIVPIGIDLNSENFGDYTTRYFSGMFNGSGHKITYEQSENDAIYDYNALFGTVYGATVCDLTIDVTASFPTGSMVNKFGNDVYGGAAGLAANVQNSTIENVEMNGSFLLGNYGTQGAGLVATAGTGATFVCCTNNTTVNLKQYYRDGGSTASAYYIVGGIVGQTSCSSNMQSPSVTFDGCVNNAAVVSENPYDNDRINGVETGYGSFAYLAEGGSTVACTRKLNAGGMVGQISGGQYYAYQVLVKDCVDNGSVIGTHMEKINISDKSYNSKVMNGGFIGRQYVGGSSELQDCTIVLNDPTPMTAQFYANDNIYIVDADCDDYSGCTPTGEGRYYRNGWTSPMVISRTVNGTATVVSDQETVDELTFVKRLAGPVVYGSVIIYQPAVACVAQIGDRKYESLQAALNAVRAGETVVVLRDCAEDIAVTNTVAFTFDANGRTLSGEVSTPAGYVFARNGEVCSYGKAVAQVGDDKFLTLAAAVAAVSDGGTVQMLVADVDEPFPGYAAAKAFTVRGLADGYTGIAGTVETAGTCGWSECGVVFENIDWTASFQKRKMSDVTFRNCKFTGTFGVRSGYVYGGSWTFADCVFEQSDVYAVHFDEGQNAAIAFAGCTIRGKANGLSAGYENAVSFTGCTFDGGADLAGEKYSAEIKMRADTLFDRCTFTGKFADGIAAEKNKDDNGINIVDGYVYAFDGCAIEDSSASVATLVVRKNLGAASFAAIDADTDGEGRYSSGVFVTKDAASVPLAPNCQLFALGDDTYQIGIMIAPKGEEKTVPAIEQKSDYAVDVVETAKVIADKTVAEKVIAETVVEGVKLTTEAETNETGFVISPAGVQAVVDSAKSHNDELRQALEADDAAMVTVRVDVVVTPLTYEPTNGTETAGSISFKLEPKALVTVVNTNGDAQTSKSQEVEVTNQMIDKSRDITVRIYTGFEPKLILHREDKDKGGRLIESFTQGTGDGQFVFDAASGMCTFVINHFSECEALKGGMAATVGGENYATLQEAFAAARDGETIAVLDDLRLSAAVALAAGKTNTLDLAGKTISWASEGTVTKTSGLVASSGALTITGGTLDAGADTLFATCAGGGTIAIADGEYVGKFPAPADPAATNAGPFYVSGGSFKVPEPIPAAYCAEGYVPNSTAVGGVYTVQDAEIYIRNIFAKQRYPWNGKVDITFEVRFHNHPEARKLFVRAYRDGATKTRITDFKIVDWLNPDEGEPGPVNLTDGTFKVAAPEAKTIHLLWNSQDIFPSEKVEGISFKVLAK